MSMGKGFVITDNLDLGKQLMIGYESARSPELPRIKIAAIVNDAVATLLSFVYQFRSNPRRKAAMGLIVGTGCNATIPLALSKLHPSKRPKQVKVLDDSEADNDLKIAVNTEWAINGAAAPLHELKFITNWDKILDEEVEAPGFQPFEYMTAGRYLGELGRIIIVDYFTHHLNIPESALPSKLRERHGLTTTFLGNLGPHLSHIEPSMLKQLEAEFPPSLSSRAWHWTEEAASAVFKIGKAVQVRAAGMTAAAILGLLACADEIHFSLSQPSSPSTQKRTNLPNGETHTSTAKRKRTIDDLMVGYTGGCIVHFQDYLEDCQAFLDAIMARDFGCGSGEAEVERVVLQPCHDGGIIGAGILAGTVQSIAHDS
jgi:hexokinase